MTCIPEQTLTSCIQREQYNHNFSAEENMAKRLQTYEAPGITVTFDPEICTHSGRCVRGLPLVFDVKRKRWIQLEHESADVIAAQVARCPSGALQVSRASE